MRSRPARPLPRALRPFEVGPYRVLALSLVLSLLGSGVWLVALVWQVIALGGGPAQLSVVATATSLGLVGTVLVGGVAADRLPQRRILVGVEAVKGLAVGLVAVLALSGAVQLWHLVVVGLLLGIADGFFFPAYSAMLPAVLPAERLLAANGIEGMLRPSILQAGGPALAGAVIAMASPGWALAVVAVAQAAAALTLLSLPDLALRRELGPSRHPLRAALRDLVDGFAFMVRTPWLLATLLFASVLILIIMGPIEVLLPFAVRDQTGGGAGSFALVIGAFGLGGATGSLLVASLPLPRRYLTMMVLLWGPGCLPLAVIGFTDQLWLMALALFVVGAAFSSATVVWGTLLQRRVPPALLGRVSSLDFFVSLALMPVAVAAAGPVGERVGFPVVFAVAGVVPVVLGVITVLLARMPADEIAHPLEPAGEADREEIEP